MICPTRVVNQAVKNNPDKFPAGYVVELTQDEIKVLRSKILTLETTPVKKARGDSCHEIGKDGR